jgi:hypothetical protein
MVQSLTFSTTRLLLVVVVIALFSTATFAQTSTVEFADFKREMMPKVGTSITVEGVLLSGKLGWLLSFNGWGIYIYARRDADVPKMNQLNKHWDRQVTVKGTLRYSPAAAPQTTGAMVAAVAPEHFYFDVAEAKVAGKLVLRKPGIMEVKTRPFVPAVAPPECLATFRQLFAYVQKAKPSIVTDDAAQARWLTKNLREALQGKVATFKNDAESPDFPSNATFVGTWDSPSTFTIVSSRRYDKTAVIDVWYKWGKGTNYENDTRLSYFIFALEDGSWKLDDVYTFRGEFVRAESLNAYLRSK